MESFQLFTVTIECDNAYDTYGLGFSYSDSVTEHDFATVPNYFGLAEDIFTAFPAIELTNACGQVLTPIEYGVESLTGVYGIDDNAAVGLIDLSISQEVGGDSYYLAHV